jgi:hypothetical protein
MLLLILMGLDHIQEKENMGEKEILLLSSPQVQIV